MCFEREEIKLHKPTYKSKGRIHESQPPQSIYLQL